MRSETVRWTFGYALIQCFYWINFVTVSGYASVYLLDAGLKNSQIGLVIGIGCILAALLQPIAAGYADRPSAVSIKVIVVTAALAAAALAVVLMLLKGSSPLVIGLVFALCTILLEFLMPFINALGTEVISQGISVNWGISRAAGSIAYAGMSSLLGVLTAGKGAGIIAPCILLGFLLLTAGVLVYPFRKQKQEVEVQKDTSEKAACSASPAAFIRKYPKFGLLLIGVILVYTSHMLLNTYLYQIVESKGGGSIEMGHIMSLCAIVELVPLVLFSLLLKKAGCDVWLRISGIFMAVKALGTLLAPSIPALYGVSLLQLAGWGLIAVAPVYYVNHVIAKEDAIKGQAYMGMTYTLGCVISSMLGGTILDCSGVNAMLVFAVIAGTLGAGIMLVFTERLPGQSRMG